MSTTTKTAPPPRSRRRWGDNDRHLGPFTFAFRESYRPFAAILSSGSTDDDEGGCHIRLQAFGATLICELPPIIKPWRQWLSLVRFSRAHHPTQVPGEGYWDEHRREYGFSLSEGHFHMRLGRQTMDSSTTQDWGCFLPWTQWRMIAHRVYGADGGARAMPPASLEGWQERQRVMDNLPKESFGIVDFDGEMIMVTAYVEEREWRLGTGWFRWLGYLAPRRKLRSLDIRFSSEVGRDKGSWKGGTIGHGIDMLPGETAEQAMRRYCDQDQRSKCGPYRITFVSPATAVSAP